MASDVSFTLLVVDDEPDVVDALRRSLRDPSWRVVAETSARAALDRLASEPVDLVISDIDMPGMTGVELVSRIRHTWPDVVRILLTGGASLGSAVRAINEGEVHRYLVKPWDNHELRETVRAALGRLSELRRSAAADHRAAVRAKLLAALEAEYPAITHVDREGDVYVLEERALARIVDLRAWFSGTDPSQATWVHPNP
jgi:response regulator RpfG family c-di-GMP phosphodiesterase